MKTFCVAMGMMLSIAALSSTTMAATAPHVRKNLSTAPSVAKSNAATAPAADESTADESSTSESSGSSAAAKLLDSARPSLVAVKYTFVSELGSQELSAAGVVISDDGVVMLPINIVTPQFIADGQMKDFKIVIPSRTHDDVEIDATLQSRDERAELAYIKAAPGHKWHGVHFVSKPAEVGERLMSVGILPKGSGYTAFVKQSMVSAKLRGPVPHIFVDGSLASVGGVVFDSAEEAVGFIFPSSFQDAVLDNPQNPDNLSSITNPPRMYVPTSDFALSVDNPPTQAKPAEIPWVGCELKGVEKEVAEYFGLKNEPALQVGDVVPDSPAEKAGLKSSDLIVSLNGKKLDRGDIPAELPAIFTRKVQWMKPGETLTLGIIREQGKPPIQITLTLADRPKQPSQAKRFYAKDLGFVVRDVVFVDTYRRKLKPATPGVVVALLRPQAAAQAAKLSVGDLITDMNGKPVTNLDDFKKAYDTARKTHPHDALVLLVSQGDGKQQTINIEPPQTDAVPGGDVEP